MADARTQAAFEERHRQLKQKFAERTLNDAARLEDLLTEFTQSDSESGEEIRQIAHRIAGGAGIFGLDRLTEPSALVEDLIIDKRAAETVRTKTEALIAHMRREAETV
ncbi:Hpt domain-containing protein [Cucumibacter marinus]|uniref:Hpt domain-containing protein n=1 Tax=Cucumibacter marinus TaxID=1121252 RepID=UPI000409E393|nr:Hpt domain-containing protein [Cucumibacter marinus]